MTYQFRFTTKVLHATPSSTTPARSPRSTTRTGTARSSNSVNADRAREGATASGHEPGLPPVNVGTRSTPHYGAVFTPAAVHPIQGSRTVFAGQRGDAFYVDLGSVFDLGALRPFQNLHLIPLPSATG